MKYNIQFSVIRVANGSGDDVVDGQRTIVATGQCVKEAASAQELEQALRRDLRLAFPETQVMSTYNYDHSYEINIREV